MLFPFIMDFSIKIGIYFIIMYLSGLLVLKKGVKVNYTRKINHFSLLAVPFLLGRGHRDPDHRGCPGLSRCARGGGGVASGPGESAVRPQYTRLRDVDAGYHQRQSTGSVA